MVAGDVGRCTDRCAVRRPALTGRVHSRTTVRALAATRHRHRHDQCRPPPRSGDVEQAEGIQRLRDAASRSGGTGPPRGDGAGATSFCGTRVATAPTAASTSSIAVAARGWRNRRNPRTTPRAATLRYPCVERQPVGASRIGLSIGGWPQPSSRAARTQPGAGVSVASAVGEGRAAIIATIAASSRSVGCPDVTTTRGPSMRPIVARSHQPVRPARRDGRYWP